MGIGKRAAALVAGLAVATSTMVTTELPATAADTGCSTAFTTYSHVREGAEGDQARGLECLLDVAGFTTTVDGDFSADDAAVLAKYRHSIGLKSVKVAGPRVWSSLLAQGSRPVLARKATGDDVVRLQQSLRGAGFRSVRDTATVDAATVAAVKRVQKLRHEKVTGVATTHVWRALQRGRVSIGLVKAAEKAAAKKAKAKRAAAKRRKAHAGRGARALAFARRQLGDRYRYGAAGPSAWDCSGLTMGAYRSVGIHLPHSARAQFHRGHKVSKSHLRKGDLVFFYSGPSHVAIYAGHGKVIHAPRPGKRVSYISMKYMPFKGARRL